MIGLLLACGTPEVAPEPPPRPSAHEDLQGRWTLDDPRLAASWTFDDPKVTLELADTVRVGTYTVLATKGRTLELQLDDGPITARVEVDALTLERADQAWRFSRSASKGPAPSPRP